MGAFKLTAAAVFAALAFGAPAQAAVFTASTNLDFTYAGFESLFLPKYAGLGAITSVKLTFVGETSRYQDLWAGDDPVTIPETPVSWSVTLNGPGVDCGGCTTFALLGSQAINTSYFAIDLPADPGGQYTRVTPLVPFSITAFDANLGLYAGTGDNEFIVSADIDDPTRFAGTLTEYITTSAAPEPATWAMMILGVFAMGGVLRRRRTSAFA